MELGEGIASLAFWGFIAALVLGLTWDGVKKREAEHETLRRMLESGKAVDETLMTKLMGVEVKHPDRGLVISAIIVFSVAVGLAVLAAALSRSDENAVMPLLGAAGLCACVGGGLLVASVYIRRSRADDDARARQRPHAS